MKAKKNNKPFALWWKYVHSTLNSLLLFILSFFLPKWCGCSSIYKHTCKLHHCTGIYFQILTKDKRAIGVEIVKNNRKTTVYTNKEVILSGGSVNSPQLLMLSGIGPKKHLEEHGVRYMLKLIEEQGSMDYVTWIDTVFRKPGSMRGMYLCFYNCKIEKTKCFDPMKVGYGVSSFESC